tara:strand:- start:784 stop:1626 length:843 start_codon:yes stop_codon:yes gene_type:complete
MRKNFIIGLISLLLASCGAEANNNKTSSVIKEDQLKERLCSEMFASISEHIDQISEEKLAEFCDCLFEVAVNQLGINSVEVLDSIDGLDNTEQNRLGDLLGKTVGSECGKILFPNKNQSVLRDNSYGHCEEGDCENGMGTFIWDIGDRYVGENKYGRKHGKGTIYFSSGNKFVGSFVNGSAEGHGIYTSKTEGGYIGEYHNSLRHGYGTFTYPNGNKYEGEFKNGKKHGHGTAYFDGDKYVGGWKNDKKHGHAIVFLKGVKHESEWVDGKLVGSNGELIE